MPFLVSTRIHQTNASNLVDVDALGIFIDKALSWSDEAAVAVAVGSDGEAGAYLLQQVERIVTDARIRYGQFSLSPSLPPSRNFYC